MRVECVSDGVKMVEQDLLAAGFDVGERCPRDADFSGELGLVSVGARAMASDAPAQFPVDVLSSHLFWIALNTVDVNVTNALAASFDVGERCPRDADFSGELGLGSVGARVMARDAPAQFPVNVLRSHFSRSNQTCKKSIWQT